ncbi:MAG: IS110 family transposase [Bacilli bacterium]|nr:IS110 family transposase [Bacilli bacterium]
MPTYFVGIDVSKFKHTCCIISEYGEIVKKSFDFSNSKQGFDSLIEIFKSIDQSELLFQIVMEATGHYHECLFRYLVANNYLVQIKNPVVIARFKQSEYLDKAKTDNLDALLIARYASKHPFSPSMLKSYNIERIRRISRAKYFLYQDKERTINHLHRYLDESFPELIPFLRKRGDIKRYQGRNFFDSKTTLWFVENFPSAKKFSNARSETAEKLRRMSKGAFSLIKFSELRNIAKNSIGVSFQETEEIIIQLVHELRNIQERNDKLDELLVPLIDETAPNLLTVPGIGYRLAGLLISEIGDASQFPSADKIIKFAGLDVRVYQSGTIEKHGAIRKRGSPLLRYALFQAAEKARIHCPEIAEFYSKKKGEGKHPICALTHTARKILRIVWALLKTGQNYSQSISD